MVFQINFLKANYQSLQNYTHLLRKVNSNKLWLVILYPNLRPAVNEMGASVSLSPTYRMQIYGTFSQAFSPLLSGAQYSQSIVASPWRAPLKILTLHQSSHLTMAGHLSFSQHSQIFLLHVGFLRMVELKWSVNNLHWRQCELRDKVLAEAGLKRYCYEVLNCAVPVCTNLFLLLLLLCWFLSGEPKHPSTSVKLSYSFSAGSLTTESFLQTQTILRTKI